MAGPLTEAEELELLELELLEAQAKAKTVRSSPFLQRAAGMLPEGTQPVFPDPQMRASLPAATAPDRMQNRTDSAVLAKAREVERDIADATRKARVNPVERAAGREGIAQLDQGPVTVNPNVYLGPGSEFMLPPDAQRGMQAEREVYRENDVTSSVDAATLGLINSTAGGLPGIFNKDFRGELAQASEDQPGAYTGGTVAGIVPTSIGVWNAFRAPINALARPFTPTGADAASRLTRYAAPMAGQVAGAAGQNAYIQSAIMEPVRAEAAGEDLTLGGMANAAARGLQDPLNLLPLGLSAVNRSWNALTSGIATPSARAAQMANQYGVGPRQTSASQGIAQTTQQLGGQVQPGDIAGFANIENMLRFALRDNRNIPDVNARIATGFERIRQSLPLADDPTLNLARLIEREFSEDAPQTRDIIRRFLLKVGMDSPGGGQIVGDAANAIRGQQTDVLRTEVESAFGAQPRVEADAAIRGSLDQFSQAYNTVLRGAPTTGPQVDRARALLAREPQTANILDDLAQSRNLTVEQLIQRNPLEALHEVQSTLAEQVRRGRASGADVGALEITVRNMQRPLREGVQGYGELQNLWRQWTQARERMGYVRGAEAGTAGELTEVPGFGDKVLGQGGARSSEMGTQTAADVFLQMDELSQRAAGLSVRDVISDELRKMRAAGVDQRYAAPARMAQVATEGGLDALRRVFGEAGDRVARRIEQFIDATEFARNIDPEFNSATMNKGQAMQTGAQPFAGPMGQRAQAADSALSQSALADAALLMTGAPPILSIMRAPGIAARSLQPSQRTQRNIASTLLRRGEIGSQVPPPPGGPPPIRPIDPSSIPGATGGAVPPPSGSPTPSPNALAPQGPVRAAGFGGGKDTTTYATAMREAFYDDAAYEAVMREIEAQNLSKTQLIEIYNAVIPFAKQFQASDTKAQILNAMRKNRILAVRAEEGPKSAGLPLRGDLGNALAGAGLGAAGPADSNEERLRNIGIGIGVGLTPGAIRVARNALSSGGRTVGVPKSGADWGKVKQYNGQSVESATFGPENRGLELTIGKDGEVAFTLYRQSVRPGDPSTEGAQELRQSISKVIMALREHAQSGRAKPYYTFKANEPKKADIYRKLLARETGDDLRSYETADGTFVITRKPKSDVERKFGPVRTVAIGADDVATAGAGGGRAPIRVKGMSKGEGNKHGLMPHLRMQSSQPPAGKAKLVQDTNAANASRQIDELDNILKAHPNALNSPQGWAKMMADALGSDDVPVAPYAFIRDMKDGTAQKTVQSLTPGQIADADHGFSNAAKMKEAYISGRAKPSDTGALFAWGFLSRGVSPYTQESLFIDAFNGLGKWIDDAASGTFDIDAYLKWAKTVAPAGGNQPGAGASHNLNAFGSLFLQRMSEKVPGKNVTKMEYLHNLMSDPNMTGPQIRREFARIGQGVGIDNKVVSFTLLVSGRDDVMVLDRVQIRKLWNDGRFDGMNLYDGHKVNGAVATGSALSNLTYGARGLLVYEAIERHLAKNLKNIYAGSGREGNASIGRYHWETWVADSQQEASHGTLDAVLKRMVGDDNPMAGVVAKQGEYGSYSYGARYGRDAAGAPFIDYPTPSGATYRMTPQDFAAFREEIKKAPAGIIPRGKFSVSDAGDQPWYNKEGVNKAALDDVAARYGRRVDGGSVSGIDGGLGQGQNLAGGRQNDFSGGASQTFKGAQSGASGSQGAALPPIVGAGFSAGFDLAAPGATIAKGLRALDRRARSPTDPRLTGPALGGLPDKVRNAPAIEQVLDREKALSMINNALYLARSAADKGGQKSALAQNITAKLNKYAASVDQRIAAGQQLSPQAKAARDKWAGVQQQYEAAWARLTALQKSKASAADIEPVAKEVARLDRARTQLKEAIPKQPILPDPALSGAVRRAASTANKLYFRYQPYNPTVRELRVTAEVVDLLTNSGRIKDAVAASQAKPLGTHEKAGQAIVGAGALGGGYLAYSEREKNKPER